MALKLLRRIWPLLGALGGMLALYWVLRDIELDQLLRVVSGANYFPLLLLLVFILLEQVLRAVKWRQLLFSFRPIGVWRLFGAIMVGQLTTLLAPLGVSPLVRGWLIARLENLRLSTILATIALDRIVDGLVFLAFAAFVIVFFRFPEAEETVRNGILWGAFGSLMGFTALIAGLVGMKFALRRGFAPFSFFSRRIPERLRRPTANFVHTFLEGAVLPDEAWRQLLIVAASILVKVIAISHFVWVGFAFGVVLGYGEYIFLMVFLGFLMMLASGLKIVGSFTAGTVFALRGLGVDVETAFAMAVVAQAVTHITIAVIGVAALWIQGVRVSELIGKRKDGA